VTQLFVLIGEHLNPCRKPITRQLWILYW